ncbi:serpentine type 7TM GPCR chemoreceptor srv domain-containing protein [Ditylenchus destructor]|uniref:Serpentine type 7TM GPCR chemoreceptor srv domain-containing protein n=1 Tax=Ditylenchus destructor TaxID=166010 RepID=A0AAD4N236_9BILA|nr:serpentine type 7TM GPCR chemoreceptor srv domain-containing protein [Ditylenchus destructor]
MGSMIAHYSYPSFVLALIISVPSVILYVIEVVIILKHRRSFKSAFFHLFIARFICNFLNYFGSFLYAKFGRIGLFHKSFESLHPRILATASFFNSYSFHTDNLSTFFILLNRLTLILFPLKHTKIWEKFIVFSILVIFLLPLPFTYETLGYNYYIRKQSDNWTFTLDFYREEDKTYVRSVCLCAISAVLFCVICGFLNILTIYVYHKNNRKYAMLGGTIMNKAKEDERKMESRLTIYAFVTFVAQLCMAIYNILIYITSNTALDTLFLATFNQYGWVNDLTTITIPACCLIWASSKVREKVIGALMINRKSENPLFSKSSKVESQPKTITVTLRHLYESQLSLD